MHIRETNMTTLHVCIDMYKGSSGKDRPELTRNITRLIEWCDARNIPTIHATFSPKGKYPDKLVRLCDLDPETREIILTHPSEGILFDLKPDSLIAFKTC